MDNSLSGGKRDHIQIDDIKDAKWEHNYICILSLKDNRRYYEQFYANEFENLEMNFK